MAAQGRRVEKEVRKMVKELVDLRDELHEIANDIAEVEADPTQPVGYSLAVSVRDYGSNSHGEWS
jgi:hypothetical protein